MTISVNILQMWTFSFQITWDPLTFAELLTNVLLIWITWAGLNDQLGLGNTAD